MIRGVAKCGLCVCLLSEVLFRLFQQLQDWGVVFSFLFHVGDGIEITGFLARDQVFDAFSRRASRIAVGQRICTEFQQDRYPA